MTESGAIFRCKITTLQIRLLMVHARSLRVEFNGNQIPTTHSTPTPHSLAIQVGQSLCMLGIDTIDKKPLVVSVDYEDTVDGKKKMRSAQASFTVWDGLCCDTVCGENLRLQLAGNEAHATPDNASLGVVELKATLDKTSFPPISRMDLLESKGPRGELPSLTHARIAFRNLASETLRDVSAHLVDTISTFIGALWTVLITKFPDYSSASNWIAIRNLTDNEGQVLDPSNPRSIVSYDILEHIRIQTTFLVSFLHKYRETEFMTKLKFIARGFLETMVYAAARVYHDAEYFYAQTYARIGYEERGEFQHSIILLFCHRVKMLFVVNNLDHTEVLRREFEEVSYLQKLVYNIAKHEARQGEDWHVSSFTASLEAFPGRLMQDLMSQVLTQLRDTHRSQHKERDLLRRLLAHFVNRSRELPGRLLFANDQFMDDSANGLMNRVAYGSYADVYRCYLKRRDEWEPCPVAVKVLRYHTLGSDKEHDRFLQGLLLEVVQMSTLEHENVLRLLGVSYKFGPVALVTPWMEHLNVGSYLKELIDTGAYKGKLCHQSNRWIDGIVKGLCYLHQEGIIHGDLRAANILVHSDAKRTAVIADFGLSLFAAGHNGNYLSKRSGNPLWMAPEILGKHDDNGGQPRPTQPSDIYSFAMVCIELYTAARPMPLPGQPRPNRPMNPGGKLTDSGIMGKKLWSVVQRCWDEEPGRRPTAMELTLALRGRERREGRFTVDKTGVA